MLRRVPVKKLSTHKTWMAAEQSFAEVGAEKARAAGDQNPLLHAPSSRLSSVRQEYPIRYSLVQPFPPIGLPHFNPRL